jgi:phosphoribosyl-ATP pyrophosphohydrolase/phosphoribosyl-AMP cyclohydrolase
MRTLHSVLYTEYCIYHAVAAAAAAAAILMLLLLLLLQGVPMEDVMRVLRKRFGTSGIAEKAARPPKQ